MTGARDPYNAFLDHSDTPVANAAFGPLAGLTLAVKDLFDVAGQRTGCGNPQKLAEAEPAARTAPAVQALLDAGARFVGRTQTEELAFSLTGQNAHYPYPVNPAAPGRVTGGSSSGSVAAVAGGLADIATGSDTGGSVRAPAAFTGLVGLRITHGIIPLDGTMPLAPSLDTFGWFARDIATYQKVAEVMLPAGTGLPAALRPLRVEALEALLPGEEEAGEYRRIAALAAGVVGAATTVALPCPVDDLYWAFRRIQAREAWQAHGDWISRKDRGLGPGVRERFEFGSTVDAQMMATCTALRNGFRGAFADLLGDDGVLVLPTVPSAAPLSAVTFDELQDYRERALRLLCLSGMSGFPQITLPLGTVQGAPFGISLLGPAGSDMALVRLGRRILEAAEGGGPWTR